MGEPAIDNSLIPSSTSVSQRLLGLLVLNPDLCAALDTDLLPEAERRDQILLKEVIDSIGAQPDISTAALLGYWHGTAEGQLLNDLAGREPIEDREELAELGKALLLQLSREAPLNALRQQAAQLKAKPYETLTQDEKQSLMALTQQIRSLSGRD
jgi:DNA primase